MNNIDDEEVEYRISAEKLLHAIKKHKKNTLYSKLIIYIIFLFLFCTINLQVINVHTSFQQTEIIKDSLVMEEFPLSINTKDNTIEGPAIYKNMYDIMNYQELFEWIEGPVLSTIYEDTDYRGEIKNNKFLVNMYNKVIGGVQIRQAKVKKNSCKKRPKITLTGMYCAGEYNQDNEETKDIIINNSTYKYYTNMSACWGKLGYGKIYGTSGYQIILPLNKTKAYQIFETAKKDKWIDEFTRMVSININFYNPNTNIITVFRSVFDISETGKIDTIISMYSMAYTIYPPGERGLLISMQVSYILILFYYIYDEIIDIREAASMKQYFSDSWNILECGNIILHFMTIISFSVWIITYHHIDKNNRIMVSGKFIDLYHLSQIYYSISVISAFNIFLGFIKIFKYLQLNSKFNQLWNTIKFALWDMISMFFIFFLVICGFATMGHLIYGSNCVSYHNFTSSMSSLLRILIGEFDYKVLLEINPYFTPFFFISYVFIILVVSMNMFIAVISEYYDQVKHIERMEYNKQSNNYIISFHNKFKLNLCKKNIKEHLDEIEMQDKKKRRKSVFDYFSSIKNARKKQEEIEENRILIQYKISHIFDLINSNLQKKKTNIYNHFMIYWDEIKYQDPENIVLTTSQLIEIFEDEVLIKQFMKLCKKHDQLFKKEHFGDSKNEFQQILEKLDSIIKSKKNEIII
jgi:hypothetical protein